MNLPAEERILIWAAMVWPEETQEMFYLHFCALLTVEELGCALELQEPGELDALVIGLEWCWDAVL